MIVVAREFMGIVGLLPIFFRKYMKMPIVMSLVCEILLRLHWTNDTSESVVGAVTTLVVVLDWHGGLPIKWAFCKAVLVYMGSLLAVLLKLLLELCDESRECRVNVFSVTILVCCMALAVAAYFSNSYGVDKVKDFSTSVFTSFITSAISVYPGHEPWKVIGRHLLIYGGAAILCFILSIVMPSSYSQKDLFGFISKRYNKFGLLIRNVRDESLTVSSIEDHVRLKLELFEEEKIPDANLFMYGTDSFPLLKTAIDDLELWLRGFLMDFYSRPPPITSNLAVELRGAYKETLDEIAGVLNALAENISGFRVGALCPLIQTETLNASYVSFQANCQGKQWEEAERAARSKLGKVCEKVTNLCATQRSSLQQYTGPRILHLSPAKISIGTVAVA